MSIGSASCFEKNRGAQTRTIATSATSFSATVVISGASFIPMLAYPKMPLVLESRISRVARTQGPAVRQRSEPRRQCVQGNVGEPIGRANLVAKSPAVANGRAAHASVLVFICGADSYSTTCGGSGLLFGNLVGVAGFEPATPSSRTRCATRLRYTPTVGGLITPAPLQVQA